MIAEDESAQPADSPLPDRAGQPAAPAEVDRDTAVHITQMRVLVALLTLAGLWIARSFLLQLAWAVTLAIALWPLYRQFVPKRRVSGHRVVAPLAFTIATGLVLILPLAVVVVEAARDSQFALQWVTEAQRTGVQPPIWLGHLPFGARMVTWWRDHLATPTASSALLGNLDASAIASWTGTIAAQVASRSMFFLVTLLAFFLILRDGERLAANAVSTARRVYGEFGERFVERLGAAVRGAVNGTVLVAIGEGTLIGIGYWIAGVPRPVLFTVATIAFAMLPFGAWAAFSVAGIVLLTQGQVVAAIAVVAFGATVMMIGDNLVQPALIGNSVELPFLWTFIGTFGGLETFGLVGLFVGPALMAALFLVWKEWLGLDAPGRRRRRSRLGRGIVGRVDSADEAG
ncbi:MAG: family transporter [Alphaproteobacteria bacterium]|nr:family transporter [Alphaproteobacteria bacterium]MDB5721322.1 family transporter [Alphaproteobacteria bacterium]